jgi:hypothetical protein
MTGIALRLEHPIKHRETPMKVAPALRIALTLLGMLIVVAAFAGVLLLGTAANKPALRIVVSARDFAPGEQLSTGDLRIVEQVLDPNLASLYVQEADLSAYAGAYAVDPIRRGDPLNKVKLTLNVVNPKRYALALDNPDDVVMVLPVSPDVIPSKIAAGDFVNINFVVGSESSMSQLPGETPAPFAAPIITPAIVLSPDMALSPTPDLVLPIADLMLEHVPVLDVTYEQVQNLNAASSMNGEGSESPATVDGAIKSIVVRVPKGYQTLLAFASATGKLRYAISSPLVQASTLKPNGVVDWKRMADLLRWKQAQAIAAGQTLTGSIYPNYVPPTPQLIQTFTAPPPLPTPVNAVTIPTVTTTP